MTSPITYQHLTARFDEQGIAYEAIPLSNRVTLVATTLGGRIFAFLPDREECLFFVNPAFADPNAFEGFVSNQEWNIGGDRVWIGPEIQFLIRDRGLTDGQPRFEVPVAMDPGRFSLERLTQQSCRLVQTPTLQACCLADGPVSLHVERIIRPLEDPLASSGVSTGLWFAGYEQEIGLRRTGGDPIPASWWSVTNLHPGGDVIMATLPGARHTDFIAPAPAYLHEIGPNYVRARLTGDRHYKTGYQAQQVLGRFVYRHQTSPGEGYLLVRSFYSNPAGRYLEEPVRSPGQNGCSAFVYNDDGALGGFGEFECMGAAVGGQGDPAACLDRVPLWIYAGALGRLHAVAQAFLGVAL